MPQLIPAISAAFTAVNAFAASSWVAGFLVNTVSSIAMSALATAIMGKPKVQQPGISTETTTAGGTIPQRLLFGRYATAGNMVAPMMVYQTDGNPNEWLVYVIALADLPVTGLGRVFIDGKALTIDGDPAAGLHSDAMGATVLATPENSLQNKVYIRFHNGNQTAADAYLRRVFGDYPERPWTADMIGTGVAYAVVTFKGKAQDSNYSGFPAIKFEVDGHKLLDPRSGTTVFTTNPAVIAYNILRGIDLPGGDRWGVGARSFSNAHVIAAANLCDEAVPRGDGTTRVRYQAGLEVSVGDEPHAALMEVVKAMGGDVADMGGRWLLSAGEPSGPVLSITDDDIIVTDSRSLTPYPGLDQTINAIHASYPDPAQQWEAKEAVPLYNAAFEAKDGGRRLIEELDFPAVPYPQQVRALMREMLADHRRMRTHVITLPPDALGVQLGEHIAWSSVINGYVGKLFKVVALRVDPVSLCVAMTLTERDPSDYDYDAGSDGRVPTIPSPHPVVPVIDGITGWAVEAVNAGGKPGIRMSWNAEINARSVSWTIRLAANNAVVASGDTTDLARGAITVTSGLRPSTAYRVLGRLIMPRQTSETQVVTITTLALGILPDDFDTTPPDTPPPPTLTSTVSSITASWTAEGADVAYSELEYTESGGNPVYAQAGGNRHTVNGTLPGTAFSVRRRRVDRVGNKSNWSLPATHTTAKDTVPPAVPTGLNVVGTFGAFVVKWNRNTEADLAFYELAMGAATNPTAIISATPATAIMIGDQPAGALRYFRIRAVDTSDNRSAWSATGSASTLASALTTITTADLKDLVDATSFAAGVQPIRLWTGAALPTSYQVDVLAWGGALYRWNGSAYVKDVLAPGAVQTAHLDAGVVTTQKLAVGFGGNFITNSDFKAGTTGWALAKVLGAGAETVMSINVAGQPYAGADFPTLRIAQSGAATDGYADLRFLGIKDSTGATGFGWPVAPDDWIEVSAQLAPFRCDVQFRIEWRDEAGAVLSYSPVTTQPAGFWSALNPDTWPLVWLKHKAPTDAAFAVLHLRKLPTASGANSLLFIHKPMQTSSAESRTEPTAYAPGSFTLIDGQGLLTGTVTARSVDTEDLAVNGLAHLNVAFIKEAHITGTLSAAILRAGTALTGSLTVDGTALTTVGSRSADPAARINAHTTQIDPGKITVSGATTLADWRKGGDLTKIDGGQLSANTITANKVSVGMRGVQPIGIEFEHNKPALNRASWTAGTIEYVADDGNTATASIAAGNTTTWSSGVQYICWVKGATALTVTTSQTIAVADNRVILATYEGGHKLNASYGRTIIDGNGVKTDALLVTNNAQMGAATVDHLTIKGFAIAKMLRSNKSSWQVAGASTNVLRFTTNSGEADWTSNFVALHTVAVNRLKGYHTELKVVLDQDASGSWSSSDPRSSVLQLRWQRKLSNQPAGSWVNLNLMHCNSGEFGVKTTNYLVFTDPSATSTDTGVSTMYRLVARKYNNPRFNKMNPGVSNVRCELLHYKQGI